jgi:flagellar motor switch protein FliG
MDRMGVDELLGLMDELTEHEGLAIIVNGPQGLRQELFASAGPAFVAKFVRYLTGQERLSDQFVRSAVQKARRIYAEKGGAMKIVTINKLPLLEDALNALDSQQRAQLLGEIKKEQPQGLDAVGSRLFLDASLAKLPENFLTEAFLLISPKAAAAYLDSLEGQVDVFRRLNPRLQDAIKQHRGAQELDYAMVQDARQVISQYFKEKDRQGVIDLGQINNSLLA